LHTPLAPSIEATQKIPHSAGTGVESLPVTDRLNLNSTPRTPPPPNLTFPRIRGYEILSVIGCGGMGIVYEARHKELNRRVAIKMLRGDALADREFHERFRAEAEAIARLQHPNIIQVFEIGTVEPLPFETHPSPFIALEFVDGGSLAHHTRAPQPPRAAAKTVETLARAAHAAHSLGIIHRDLKPANVLLTGNGEPKIADFGIAKQLGDDPATGDRARTRAGTVLGTPEYMAPEQLDGGAPTPSIDIYALGVILYELLTGRVPFQGETFADTMRLAMREEPVPPRRFQPSVPRDLETICLKCLEKTPGRRYESAEALADDLGRWAEGRPIRARAIGVFGRTVRAARRNPAVAALSVAVCLVALIGLTGIVYGWAEASRNASQAEANAEAALSAERAAKYAEAEAREAEGKERWERYRVSLMAAASALRSHDINAARSALDNAPATHRDWVWYQLRAQLDRSRMVLHAHGNSVRRSRFTPNARWVILQDMNNAFRLWDITEQQEYGPLDLGKNPHMPFLSEDGTILAYADGYTVRLCDRATGAIRTVLRGHTGSVGDILLSPDNTRVITTSNDGTVRTWDAKSGQQLHLFQAPADGGFPMVLSPTRRVVAARGLEGTPSAHVWDLETGRELFTLGGHGGCTHFVIFSPAGDRIVTTERFPHTNLYLWDAATGKRLAILKGHENQVRYATFSPDGKRLVSASEDRTVRVWDVSPTPAERETEALFVLRDHAGTVNHVAFSPNGTRLVSASQDRTVRYWNACTGEQLAVLCGHTDHVLQSAFRENGTELVSVAQDGTLRLWDLAAAESDYAIRGHSNFVYQAAYFPDGKRIASAAWDCTARVWNATTGQELLRLDHGAERYVVSVAVHSAGRFIATRSRAEGAEKASVRLWDASNGQLLCRWTVPTAWEDGRVAFAPCGDLFASGGRDGRVRLWDAASQSEVAVLPCGEMPIKDVAFSPDGKWLAAASDNGDCAIRIWDLSTRTQVQVLRGHTQGVYTLAWNRTGTMLASGSLDTTARLWDTKTWTTIAELPHGTRVYGIAFTAEGKLLACACADNLVRFWDVNAGRELAALSGHRNYIHHIAFSPDGRQMISASGDRTLRVWDASSGIETKSRRNTENRRAE